MHRMDETSASGPKTRHTPDSRMVTDYMHWVRPPGTPAPLGLVLQARLTASASMPTGELRQLRPAPPDNRGVGPRVLLRVVRRGSPIHVEDPGRRRSMPEITGAALSPCYLPDNRSHGPWR